MHVRAREGMRRYASFHMHVGYSQTTEQVSLDSVSEINPVELQACKGESTELIIQVAPLGNSGLVPSTASVPLPRHAANIRYIQHFLTHVVDQPFSCNSW